MSDSSKTKMLSDGMVSSSFLGGGSALRSLNRSVSIEQENKGRLPIGLRKTTYKSALEVIKSKVPETSEGRVAFLKTKEGHEIKFKPREFLEETYSKAIDSRYNRSMRNIAQTLKVASEFDKWFDSLTFVQRNAPTHGKYQFDEYKTKYGKYNITLKCQLKKGSLAYVMHI